MMKNRMNCLPPELLFEVLTHLPTKDLLKLRVVCKLWNSIICEPSFHQHHLHQLRKNNVHGYKYYLTTNGGTYRSVDVKSSETLATIEEIKLCKSHYEDCLICIKACVDGVLLVSTIYVKVIFLWNPTLGKVVDIPLYEALKKIRLYDVVFGFGFDSVSNIYKVVALYLEKNNDLKTMVYNLGSRSWTSPKMERSSIDNAKHLSHLSRSLNFEGCIYCLSKAEITSENDTHYLCFNLSSEALTCAKLPDGKIIKYAPIRRRLAVLYDSLALVDDSREDGLGSIHFHVWMRRKDSTTSSEFSWVKLYNLDCDAKYFTYLANNGILYLQAWPPNIGSVYDLKADKEKFFYLTGGYIDFMEGYLESLALLR
ncbi:putative F-box only protein 11 [Silene latifolia]|uniref:putative F-box only protein 11 n=1 Tax=Silene latifolia TaxID=37657 RepID=UPI003D77E536